MANLRKHPADISEEYAHSLGALATEPYVLELYVAGMAARSLQGISNVKRICTEYLKGRFRLEVIDIYQHPDLAESAQIVAVPTLIKRQPAPVRLLVGDLSNVEQVLRGLNIRLEDDSPRHAPA